MTSTYRWLKGPWKDTLLEKCKSKLQWDITSHQSKWLSSKNPQTINAEEGVERREPSYTVGGSVNWCSHYGEWYWGSLGKVKIKLYDPATPLLGIHPEKNMVQRDACTLMFIVALFSMAKTWKQPKCLLTKEWINKIWYIYTIEYYSAIKKWNNATLSNMDRPRDCHSEWNKSDRGEILHGIPYTWNLKRNDSNELIYKTETDSESELMVARGIEMGGGIVRESGTDMYTLLYLKQITNRVLLYSTGNSAQCYVAVWMGGEFGGKWIHIHVELSPFAVHLKWS